VSLLKPGPVLELQQADGVATRIDEPRRQGETDVSDPVHGPQARLVVVDDLDATRPQLGHLGGDVVDPPARLGRLLGARGARAGDDQSTVTAAPERHEAVALEQHLEPHPVAVEPPNRPQVWRREHHVDRVFREHRNSFAADPPAAFSVSWRTVIDRAPR
jgi:hypothetical protein